MLTIAVTALLLARRGTALFRRARLNPLRDRVPNAVVLIVGLLAASGTAEAAGVDGARFVRFLLGAATVALAIPVGIVAGSFTAAASAVAIGWLLATSREPLIPIAPKSVTAPGAMGIGTARALQLDEVAGAFAGQAMGVNALATALLLPLLWRLFFAD